MIFHRSSPGILALVACATAGVITREARTTEIFRFPGSASIEGIGIRSNGNILLTRMDAGEVWQVDPATKESTRLASLEGVTATAGIVEMAPDVWYVVGGKYAYDGGFRNTPGSWGIFRIDLTGAKPVATTLKLVPEALLFNGLSRLDGAALVIGDSQAGSLYKMDVATGAYTILVAANPAMTPAADIPFGIDGVRYNNGSIYFTNITKNLFSKLPIDASGKPGEIETIYSGTPADDLTFDNAGNAYIATNLLNSVIKVTPSGEITKIADVQGSTCAVFGRSEDTNTTLFVGGGSSVYTITM